MTDTEMLILCVDAMGYTVGGGLFNPLRDDDAAMALVKKFRISVSSCNPEFQVWPTGIDEKIAARANTFNFDLNRAIVECVAKMQAAKKSA